MPSLKNSLGLLATSLLLVLASRPGLAFTITPQQPGAKQGYQGVTLYDLPDGGTGSTFLDPGSVTAIPRGGTLGLLIDLNAAFPDWTFNAAPNDLNGSFSVEGYQALYDSGRGTVGAQFLISYNPGDNDPTPANNPLHWIQRVIDNHAVINNPGGGSDQGYGTNEDKIDIIQGQNDPFYDTSSPPNTSPGGSFYDIPGRPDPQDNNRFSAEVYLAELTAPQTVTIYNGASWGWQNTYSPPSCNGSSGGGGCSSASVSRGRGSRNLYAANIASVPESVSVLGLLALGMWGGIQGLKIRKSQ